MKISMLLLALSLLASCSHISPGLSRGTASEKGKCVDVTGSPLNITKICPGEEIYNIKSEKKSKIVEIDESAMKYDKNADTFILTEDADGEMLRSKASDIILIKDSLCYTSHRKADLKYCIKDSFKDKYGNENQVTGFRFPLGEAGQKSSWLYSKGLNDSIIRSDFDIEDQIILTRTGTIEIYGSCTEGLLPAFEYTLTKCAKKDFIKEANKTCKNFYKGAGKAVYNEKNLKGECSKEYSLFGTATITCHVNEVVKCEKTN